MKKVLVCVALSMAAASFALAADGATLFKPCAACHGAKAEKPYLGGKVPVLTTLDPAARLESMKGYKAGTIGEGGKGKVGQGGIMKAQMAKLSDEDMATVNDYISSLK